MEDALTGLMLWMLAFGLTVMLLCLLVLAVDYYLMRLIQRWAIRSILIANPDQPARWANLRSKLFHSLSFRRNVEEGEELPWYLGVAYFDGLMGRALVCPVPLNWVANGLHRLSVFLKYHPVLTHPDRFTEALRDAYTEGRNRGWDAGFQRGVEQGRNIERREVIANLKRHFPGAFQ